MRCRKGRNGTKVGAIQVEGPHQPLVVPQRSLVYEVKHLKLYFMALVVQLVESIWVVIQKRCGAANWLSRVKQVARIIAHLRELNIRRASEKTNSVRMRSDENKVC